MTRAPIPFAYLVRPRPTQPKPITTTVLPLKKRFVLESRLTMEECPVP
jgi:hypothetical protein